MLDHIELGIRNSSSRCLVLGGGGFLGKNLCGALSRLGFETFCFSKIDVNIPNVKWIPGDFCDDGDLEAATVGMDIVFHLISTTTPASGDLDPLADAQSNILQTIKLLEACRRAEVGRIVFVSSGGTLYGNADVLPTPESQQCLPVCAYGISKLAVEKYLLLYERLYGVTGISLRVANPYGPGQLAYKNQGVIGAFIRKALRDESIEIWGNGQVVRDYIFIDDVIEALIKSAFYKGQERVFNIGSGCGTSINDIVILLERELKKSLAVKYHEARSLDVMKSILDCSLAEREMNWRPQTTLEEGVSRTISWFKNQ
jgi:UDP-glucose 4-epimerase